MNQGEVPPRAMIEFPRDMDLPAYEVVARFLGSMNIQLTPLEAPPDDIPITKSELDAYAETRFTPKLVTLVWRTLTNAAKGYDYVTKSSTVHGSWRITLGGESGLEESFPKRERDLCIDPDTLSATAVARALQEGWLRDLRHIGVESIGLVRGYLEDRHPELLAREIQKGP